MFPLLNLTLKSLSNMPITGAGFLGSFSRRHGYLSSPRPRYTRSKAWWWFFCLFVFSICPRISMRVLAQQSDLCGVGMQMEALGTCSAWATATVWSWPNHWNYSVPRFLQLWNGHNSPSSFSSLLREVDRRLPLHDEGLTVPFCKVQDFSSLNSLTIVI